MLEGNAIENLKSYKLVGVYVTGTLKWDVRVVQSFQANPFPEATTACLPI